MPKAPVPTATLPVLLVFEGDSQTSDSFYPPVVSSTMTMPMRRVNVSTGGESLDQMITQGPTQVDPLYDARNVGNVCIIWAGTNDIALEAQSGATAYTRLVIYAAARRAVGFKVVIVTMLPRGDTTALNNNYETHRTTFNTSIRTNAASICDAVADVGGDANIGQFGQDANTTYYDGQNVHMNQTGYNLIASYVVTAIRSLGSDWH